MQPWRPGTAVPYRGVGQCAYSITGTGGRRDQLSAASLGQQHDRPLGDVVVGKQLVPARLHGADRAEVAAAAGQPMAEETEDESRDGTDQRPVHAKGQGRGERVEQAERAEQEAHERADDGA
jgi:hypothetical protein